MKHLEVFPLGGLGEFGMNCCALRYADEMILIDAGVTFPSGNLTGLGIDLIIPDIEFLLENQAQLKAILLTHGHEDHAGAVAFIADDLGVPVYGSRLTLGLVQNRLNEHKLTGKIELRTMKARQSFELGPFRVEPLMVTHSFPDSFALAIQTPLGTIIWSGDFKFDPTPIDGRISDLARLAHYGEEGVLALFSDSTNSDVPGLSPSESSVAEPLGSLIAGAPGKLVVSCFASSIHRMQLVIDLAQERGKKVVLAGRSMITNARVATQLGHLKVPPDLLISKSAVKDHSPDRILILATGSQGEPMAALSRLAVNEFRGITIEEGDTILLSTRIIPGNERLISNLVSHFYRRGAKVIDSRDAPIHASGHGFRADLKLMMNLTRPRFFVPIHGEYRQLKNHAELARGQGLKDDQVRIIETGDVLELGQDSMEVTGKVPVGRRFIDDGQREEVDELVIRDRRFLSEDGFVVVVLRLDRFNGDLLEEPELVSRGFVMMEDSPELFEAARGHILSIVEETPAEERTDEDLFKEILRKRFQRFLRRKTGKRPVIIPLMLEI